MLCGMSSLYSFVVSIILYLFGVSFKGSLYSIGSKFFFWMTNFLSSSRFCELSMFSIPGPKSISDLLWLILSTMTIAFFSWLLRALFYSDPIASYGGMQLSLFWLIGLLKIPTTFGALILSFFSKLFGDFSSRTLFIFLPC